MTTRVVDRPVTGQLGAWVVVWPSNDDEPLWLFDVESDARAFAASIDELTTVRWEPIFAGGEQAAHIIGLRTARLAA